MDKKLSLADECPKLASEWSDKNKLSPAEVTSGSRKAAVWKCSKCGNEWSAIIKSRAKLGNGCPYCGRRRVLAGYNDLATEEPEIANQWADENYPHKPTEFLSRSNFTAMWVCNKGHKWKSRIADRTKGHGCPYCAGKLLEGYNDFEKEYPDLAAEWSDRNKVPANKVKPLSREQRWWKCSKCGYEWQSSTHHRIKDSTCPNCSREHSKEERALRRKFARLIPQAAFGYYAVASGLKVVTDDDSVIGVPYDLYFPDNKAAIIFNKPEFKAYSTRRRQNVITELSNKAGITLFRLINVNDDKFEDCINLQPKYNTEKALGLVISRFFNKIGKPTDIDITKDKEQIFEYFKGANAK